jgi:organic hydroperoxide reductase OsmC/OhrA
MSQHHATIDWHRGSTDFSYEEYPRDHTWTFEGGIEVAASAAPTFRGTPDRVDPEDAFVASLAACHMLTFLALAARKNFVIESYRDSATGLLAKNEDGRLAMTTVTLRPDITFGDSAPTAEELERLHHQAHRGCFIANSVITEVTVEPVDR